MFTFESKQKKNKIIEMTCFKLILFNFNTTKITTKITKNCCVRQKTKQLNNTMKLKGFFSYFTV
jgi:hypothetical protein